jgi:hypothetical protein
MVRGVGLCVLSVGFVAGALGVPMWGGEEGGEGAGDWLGKLSQATTLEEV